MNATSLARRAHRFGRRTQRGVATLLVAVIMLVILTIIVLASSNVALFEQKTATNDNRQRLVQQAAEYVVTLGSEYLKANITKISTDQSGGWFDSTSTVHWQLCPSTDPTDLNHPCYAEPNASRRHKMYYYTSDGAAHLTSTDAALNLPYTDAVTLSAAQITTEGNSTFAVDTHTVKALLCLLELPSPAVSPAPAAYPCETFANRTHGQRLAVTLIGSAGISGENANAVVKQTYGTYNDSAAVAAVPLAAAGFVQGLGNATIVASPNAGGIGLPASIWSPQNVDIDSSGAGVGSVSTCHLGDYIGLVATDSNYQTVCAANSSPCKCTVSSSSNNFLSGHTTSVKREDIDIIDVDHWPGDAATPTTQPLPDITFYPGRHCTSAGVCTRLDTTSTTDDNLFEWIFNEDVNGGNNAGYPATAAMDAAELAALDSDFGAQHLADCSTLNSASSGTYYIEGACDLPNATIGSPDAPVIVVVNDNTNINGNTVFYGMLFVRDTTAAACTAGGFSPTPAACLSGTGGKFFGSIVVEGDVKLAGDPQIVYVVSNVSSKSPPPKTTRFARISGSWLDNQKAF